MLYLYCMCIWLYTYVWATNYRLMQYSYIAFTTGYLFPYFLLQSYFLSQIQNFYISYTKLHIAQHTQQINEILIIKNFKLWLIYRYNSNNYGNQSWQSSYIYLLHNWGNPSDPLQCHDSCFDLLPASYTYVYINIIDAFIMTPHRLSTFTPKCHAFT